jgi:hypothetical protein
VLFTGAIDIINTLASAHAAGGLKRALAAYVKPEVLCIDLCAELSDVKQPAKGHHPPTVLGSIACSRTAHNVTVAGATR